MANRSRTKNLALLIAGYLAGQGSILLASAALMGNGEFEIAAGFGLGIAVISLLLQIADFGGLTYLAKQSHSESYYRDFTALLVTRLIVALTSIIILFTLQHFFTFLGSVPAIILIGSVPGIFLWCFNVLGRLDGMNHSGLSGAFTAPPWAFASFASLVFEPYLIGILFSLGVLASISLQVIAERILIGKQSFRGNGLTLRHTLLCAKESGAILFATIPGQLTGRIHIYVSSIFLPVEVAAGFIFARNALNAGNNLVYMARRIEFPRLVALMQRPARISEILALQKVSAVASLVIVAAALLANAGVYFSPAYKPIENLSGALLQTAAFSLILPLTTFSGALTQALFAKGRAMLVLPVTYTLLFSSTIFVIPMANYFGVTGIWIATLLSNALTVPMLLAAIKRTSKK